MNVRISVAGAALLLAGCSPSERPLAYEASPPLPMETYQQLWLDDFPKASPTEAVLPSHDEMLATKFLNMASVKWAQKNKCSTCHTVVHNLMVQPLLPPGGAKEETKFIRAQVMSYLKEPRNPPPDGVQFGAAASAFAVNDALSGAGMTDDTRELFEHLWKIQGEDGSLRYSTANLLPFPSRNGRYVEMLVALGAGYLPKEYLSSPGPAAGMSRLRHFIRQHFPESLHDQAFLLWASVRTSGLLSSAEADRIRADLVRRQNADGGWTLPALGRWPRLDGAPNDPNGPSDGYATGLVTLALCESGHGASRPVARALTCLDRNQRVSGRWYTRSLYSDRFQGYLSNMATAYAMMALKRCAPTETEKRM